MKKNIFRTLCVSALCLTFAMIGVAQEDRTLSSAAGDLYVISAKAGGVNYIEGKVAVTRSNGTNGYLVKGDTLEAGDKVSTSTNARVEVLMNPGSFARLNQNSEFEFLTTSLSDLKLKVLRGSAIFEVFASNDFKVTVNTPKAKFYLINTGVYRIDVLANGVGKIEVHRGKAQVGSLAADRIGKGRTATVDRNSVAISRFNRKNTDAFENWSKSRAKLIAKANKKLIRDKLSNSLLSRNRRVNCFDSFGLWVFSPRYRSYSFLPFGNSWRSPYGHRFRTNTGICDYPYYSYPRYRRYRRYPSSGGGSGGNGGGTTPSTIPAANIERARRNSTPPFRRMERSGNGNRSRSARRAGRSTFPSRRGTTRTTSRTRSRGNQTTKTPTRRSSPSRKPVSRSPVTVKPKGRN